MTADDKLNAKLQAENDELRMRLGEAEETLRAIRSGEVDAIVVSGPQGDQVFTLAGAEQPYRLLVESMNEGAVTLAADGTILYSNSRLAEMLQIPLERIIGTPFSSFAAPSDREVFAALVENCQLRACKGKIALINGEEGYALPVQISCNTQEIAGYRGTSIVVSDLTELTVHHLELEAQLHELLEVRHELESSRDRYSNLYDLAPVGYITLDPKGTIRNVNCAGADILGVERTRLNGRSFAQYVADAARPAFAAFLGKVFASPAKETCEVALLNNGDSALYVQIVAVAAGSGDECQIALIDISERKQMEELQRYRSIVEDLTESICKINPDGIITFVNEVFCRYFGKTREELLGSRFPLDAFPDDLPIIDEQLRNLSPANPVDVIENRVCSGSGEVRWMQFVNRGIFDEAGRLIEIQSVGRDITERKVAEEDLRRSERLLAEAQRIAHLGSWQWDSLSGILTGSDEGYRIFGHFFSSLDEFLETVHPDDRERVSKAVQDTLDRQLPYDLNHRIVRPDGTIRVIHCRGGVQISGDGTGVRVIGTVQDITERRGMEDKLEIQRNELMARAAELEAANLELEAFNHSVSHDLRRPLTVINSYCQVVEELCGAKLDEECQRGIREIYAATLQMSGLIETLLVFSRVTRGEMRLEKVNLSKIAEEVSLGLKMTELKRRVTFRIADGITADCDAGLLRVVLDNLLGNAWKFTGGREEAVIEFGVTEIDGKQACYVRDNGAGFDMAYADKLFLPFQRLPGTKTDGHGIGLATADRIVRRHGGRVWAESRPGNGATFYFTLPGGFDAAGRRP